MNAEPKERRFAMTDEEQGGTMGRIVARARTDEAFRERLLADATAVLREEGVAVPEGVTVKAVENTRDVEHLVIPSRRAHEGLDEAALGAVVGGFVHPDERRRPRQSDPLYKAE